jgi:hypothetical protein
MHLAFRFDMNVRLLGVVAVDLGTFTELVPRIQNLRTPSHRIPAEQITPCRMT